MIFTLCSVFGIFRVGTTYKIATPTFTEICLNNRTKITQYCFPNTEEGKDFRTVHILTLTVQKRTKIEIDISFILLLFSFESVTVQTPISDHTHQLDDPANCPPATFEQIAWLHGHWKDGDVIREKYWEEVQPVRIIYEELFKTLKPSIIN